MCADWLKAIYCNSIANISDCLSFRENRKFSFLVSIKLHGNTCQSLGELETAVETLASSFSCSPKLPLVLP